MRDTSSKREVNYTGFFVIGCSFIVMGIALGTSVSPAFMAFIGTGAVFMVLSMSKKKKSLEA